MEENKMGVMPMKKLIMNMALPMILSMLIGALYNVVDSLFVSRFSEDALSAVSLAFPVQNIIIAIGTGIGVGVNSLLSRYLGDFCLVIQQPQQQYSVHISSCKPLYIWLYSD
jgi:Na+-driven multidrug efflux pump